MRFTLYGEAEGVLGRSQDALWATVVNGLVTDASVSARSKGVLPGVSVRAAKALLPLITLEDESDLPSSAMASIWQMLWNASPWLETVGKRAFYLQVPGRQPPLREVRRLLAAMEASLSEEQRVRVSLAENPFLARALLAWSRVERVPGACYYKVGKVQWLLSPGIADWSYSREDAVQGRWIRRLPMSALWTLPQSTQSALQKLGVYRLDELESIPRSQLVRHFGKESLLWTRFLESQSDGTVRVNYPPVQKREVWTAALGEEVSLSLLPQLLETLAQSLSTHLEKREAGALRVGMTWETDTATGEFANTAKRPVYTPSALLAVLERGIQECSGRCLRQLALYVEEVRPLQSIQSVFVFKNGSFILAEEAERKSFERLLVQVNRKFPRSLQVGLRPTFRELRLQAVLAADSGRPQVQP